MPARAASNRPRALLTVDVEDYFQVEAFASVIERADWPSFELRVENNTHLLLDLFSEHGARGTFFILGWIADQCPGLVREIHKRGHEVACHSYWHSPIYRLKREDFREDTHRAKRLLEDLAGAPVVGYRAPTFSIVRETLWALEVLVEEGFQYDASVYPIRHDNYGIPDWPRWPQVFDTPAGPILEVPGSTVRRLGMNLPCGGGGYLRLLPLRFNIKALREIWTKDRQHGVIYVHPWEVDPGQPRLRASLLSRLRHYTGLRRTARRLGRLLSEFTVGPVAEVLRPLDEVAARAAARAPEQSR